MGVLATRGAGWGASDAELVEALTEMEREHPSLIDAHPSSNLSISTASPPRLVTLANDVIVVRDAAEPAAMPSVWTFASLRRTGPGRPLVVRDTEEIEHRLGVVRLVSSFDPADAPPLTGLRRDALGEARWLVLFEDGNRAVVGPRLRVWEQHRRDVEARVIAWDRIVRCAAAENMEIAPAGGGKPVVLGRVKRSVLLGPVSW